MIQTLSALIVGALQNIKHLENVIDFRFDFNNSTNKTSNQSKNEIKRNKINSKTESMNNQFFLTNMQNFLQAYLTCSSLEIYKDPNCRLVNIIRNYLYTFSDDLNSDLKSNHMPNIKDLKRGINEVLNSWSTIIINSMNVINNQFPFACDYFFTSNSCNFINSSKQNTTDHFRYFTEIRENKPQTNQTNQTNQTDQQVYLLTSLNDKNEITTQIIQQNEQNQKSKEKLAQSCNTNEGTRAAETVLNMITSSDESVENYHAINEKSSADEYEKALHGNVGPQLKNTSKIFKPILNFIGIDAPSGTLIDNLFKEFGSLLFGNLNIKSVQINILGSINPRRDMSMNSNNESEESKLSQSFKKQSFFRTRSNPSSSDSILRDKEIAGDKIITTILSFDDLLFNINVRQVMPADSSSASVLNSKTNLTNTCENAKLINNDLSMTNPVYTATNQIVSSQNNSPKYYTKIDAGIRVNNLTQEVNMPLLRLVHQIYSIIADAIDNEKEQNKINSSLCLKEHLKEHLNQSIFLNVPSPNSNKDCWKYMNGLMELRDFVPEPKYVEKVN